MQRFKTMAMKRYADSVTRLGWPPFRGRLWQRGYYARVIREEDELNRIRRYIIENPAHWPTDPENPAVVCARARVNAPTGKRAFSDNMEELAGVRETRQPQGDASDDRSH